MQRLYGLVMVLTVGCSATDSVAVLEDHGAQITHDAQGDVVKVQFTTHALPFSDNELIYFKTFPKLRDLSLHGTAVTESGLVHLAGMKLDRLFLPDHLMTDVGLQHYLKALEPKRRLNLGRWSITCLLYTSPSPRDLSTSRMPSSA